MLLEERRQGWPEGKSDSVTTARMARSLASAGIASKIVEDDDSARVAILDFTTEN